MHVLLPYIDINYYVKANFPHKSFYMVIIRGTLDFLSLAVPFLAVPFFKRIQFY